MLKETEGKITQLTIKILDEIANLTKYSIKELKKLYPFHAIFFPEDALPYAKKERSIVTKMGTMFYPSLAEILAKARYKNVDREHIIEKELDSAKINAINKIVDDLRANRRKPNYNKETIEMLTAKGTTVQIARTIADLFIGDHQEGALFIEIKSPLPNLDVCDESKRKMLTFLAMMNKEKRKGRAFFGLTYNPYGEGNKYKWSFTKRIMDLDNEVLIGKKFWDKIGGPGAFEEVLRVATKARDIWTKRSKQQTLI